VDHHHGPNALGRILRQHVGQRFGRRTVSPVAREKPHVEAKRPAISRHSVDKCPLFEAHHLVAGAQRIDQCGFPGAAARGRIDHHRTRGAEERPDGRKYIEQEVLPVARELGIGIVPYSPLRRGLLTGAFERPDQVPERLKTHPRYVAGAFDANKQLVDAVAGVASRLGVDPGQVALAWVLSRGPDVVPIPGTRSAQHVLRNVGALDVRLTADELAELDPLAGHVVGHRSPRPHAVGVEAPERPV
jgi:hypothetical protein